MKTLIPDESRAKSHICVLFRASEYSAAARISLCHRLCTIRCQVLIQIGKHVALDPDIFRVKGHAGGGLRVYARGMIDEIRVKAGGEDFLGRHFPGELV